MKNNCDCCSNDWTRSFIEDEEVFNFCQECYDVIVNNFPVTFMLPPREFIEEFVKIYEDRL